MLNMINSAEGEGVTSSRKSVKREILYWIRTLVIILVVVFLIRNFVATVALVNGQSMEPTLQNNDRVVIWRLGYEPKQGDIVVFKRPVGSGDDYWIKRVIATEGQQVKIDYSTSSVYVDGKIIDESYLGEPMYANGNSPVTEVEVPENHIFVMGDNRNKSKDSREVGTISEDELMGKAVVRFYPFHKFEIY